MLMKMGRWYASFILLFSQVIHWWLTDVFTGWSGSGGLGAKEQGIQDPIKGGDIRDKWDQYKGVGVALDDPYVNYRRNKSYNFVARMKAREKGIQGFLYLSNTLTISLATQSSDFRPNLF